MEMQRYRNTQCDTWYIKGQDGNWYRSEKKSDEPFDEYFWKGFHYVPWCGY